MKHPELLAQLSLEEKAALCSGKDFWHLNGVSRLGLPEIMVSDGPHGLRKHNDKKDKTDLMGSVPAVCFPTASATACSVRPQTPPTFRTRRSLRPHHSSMNCPVSRITR